MNISVINIELESIKIVDIQKKKKNYSTKASLRKKIKCSLFHMPINIMIDNYFSKLNFYLICLLPTMKMYRIKLRSKSIVTNKSELASDTLET